MIKRQQQQQQQQYDGGEGGNEIIDQQQRGRNYNNNNNNIKKIIIDKIQSITISPSLIRRIKYHYSNYCIRNNKEHNDNNNESISSSTTSLNKGNNDVVDNENDVDDVNNKIYLIEGLEHVFIKIPGDSCADSVRICGGYQPYCYIWYMISGSTCDIIQFIITIIIHYGFYINDPSVCWAIGFIISIIFRHTFHRYLVFGNYVGGYYWSLLRMYTAYSIIIILSTLFNYVVNRIFAIHFIFIFILTLLWTGIANYFILKKIWSFNGNSG